MQNRSRVLNPRILFPGRFRSGRRAFLSLIGLFLLSVTLTASADPPYNPVQRDEKYLQQDLARLAKSPHDPELLREAGMSYNVVGSPDNWTYIKKARALLTESNKLKPDDPYTLIFLGSSIAMLARDPSVSFFSKSSLVSEGLGYMDRAVTLAPKSYRVRLMRATSGLAIPAVFMRDKLLEEDAEFVRAFLEPEPPKDVPKHIIAGGYLFLGAYQEKKSDLNKARQYYRQAIVYGHNSRYEEQARKKLARITP